jgi:hypothetical protein
VQNERRSLCSLRIPQLIGELAGAADAVIAYCTTIRCAAEENRDTHLLVRGRCDHTHIDARIHLPRFHSCSHPTYQGRCVVCHHGVVHCRFADAFAAVCADGLLMVRSLRAADACHTTLRIACVATAACRATCNGRARCTDALAMERARVRIGELSRACWPELRASTACACALWSARADPLRSARSRSADSRCYCCLRR